MCGIIGYKGPKNAVEVVLNGLKDLEYRGYDSWGSSTNVVRNININFGHIRWALEKLIKQTSSYNLKHSKRWWGGMNILNLVKKENYYALISKNFQSLLQRKISDKKELLKNVNVSNRTLYRITKKEDYWCNLQTLFYLIAAFNIKEEQLINNIRKIKTKNSFPTDIKEININSMEISRILGHILGDGGIHVIESEGKYRAFYVNNEQKLLDSFHEDVKKVFGDFKLYFRKRVGHGDEVWLPSTIGFPLYKLLNYQELNKKKRVPKFIFNSNEENICSFLQAIFDDEGTVSVSKHMIVIDLGSELLLEDIRNLILSVGIHCNQIKKIIPKNRSIMYRLSVTGKANIQRFQQKIDFLHPLKRERISLLIKRYR